MMKAPQPVGFSDAQHPIVFAAGSIEMGRAEMWQERLFKDLEKWPGLFLNPRRDDWDSTWRQSIEDDRFRGQVEWELSGLECADVVPMYFAPETKAPITLLEFGLTARRAKLVVCCPKDFYRRGNIEVVSASYGIPLFESWDPWVDTITKYLRRFQ
jgi:hypothetical protein